jgi:hypothetical protein
MDVSDAAQCMSSIDKSDDDTPQKSGALSVLPVLPFLYEKHWSIPRHWPLSDHLPDSVPRISHAMSFTAQQRYDALVDALVLVNISHEYREPAAALVLDELKCTHAERTFINVCILSSDVARIVAPIPSTFVGLELRAGPRAKLEIDIPLDSLATKQ